MKKLIISIAALAISTGAALAQDVAAGEQSFKKCSVCHKIGEGATNSIGPILNGLDGRKSGSVEDYSYSDANKAAGIVWSEATFKDYIQDPQARIPNTKMFYPGVKNEKEKGDLWAYLKQFDQNGKKK